MCGTKDEIKELKTINYNDKYLELQKFLKERISTGDRLTELSLEQRKDEATQKIKERETERIGREKYYQLREKWSDYLIRLLWAMISFQIVLVIFIGFGWLNFTEYREFLYAAVIESFLQIVGMCWIVVRFLFPNKEENKE